MTNTYQEQRVFSLLLRLILSVIVLIIGLFLSCGLVHAQTVSSSTSAPTTATTLPSGSVSPEEASNTVTPTTGTATVATSRPDTDSASPAVPKDLPATSVTPSITESPVANSPMTTEPQDAAVSTSPIHISSENDLTNALHTIPADGTAHELTFVNDLTVNQAITILNGQHVTFKNQNQAVKIAIAQPWTFSTDSDATFIGAQLHGIMFVPTATFSGTSALIINGHVSLTNTTVAGFNIQPATTEAYFQGPVQVSGPNAALALNQGGCIFGNLLTTSNTDVYHSAGGIVVKSGGTLTLNDGAWVTQNEVNTINGHTGYYDAGGIVVTDGSHIVMNGGRVDHNKGLWSGGISVGNNNGLPNGVIYAPSTFEMTGGSISDNRAWVAGGGLYLDGNASGVINHGTITNNTVGRFTNGTTTVTNPFAVGGGIGVDTGFAKLDWQDLDFYNTHNLATLTINDGLIGGNIAEGPGGGIYVNSNNVTINQARITNNRSNSHGGGIYLSIADYTLHLGKTLVTANRTIPGTQPIADGFVLNDDTGGGLWFCPTGAATINVTDGAAIFGNLAGKAGNDFASVQKPNNTPYSVTLANRLLGGGQVQWFHDRDGQSSTDPITVTNVSTPLALKSTALSVAETRAAELASVMVTNNVAVRGGGIGSNGTIIFGQPDTKIIMVNKVWVGQPTTIPPTVVIDLRIADPSSVAFNQVIDSVALTAQTGWQASFRNLPTNQVYTLTEEPIAGFASSNTGLIQVDATHYRITFNNTPIPPVTPPVTPPTTPVVPGNPTPPTTPVVPTVPASPKTPAQPTPPVTAYPNHPNTFQPNQPGPRLTSISRTGGSTPSTTTQSVVATSSTALPRTVDDTVQSILLTIIGGLITLFTISGSWLLRRNF